MSDMQALEALRQRKAPLEMAPDEFRELAEKEL